MLHEEYLERNLAGKVALGGSVCGSVLRTSLKR
jgi:hypothetical protein